MSPNRKESWNRTLQCKTQSSDDGGGIDGFPTNMNCSGKVR